MKNKSHSWERLRATRRWLVRALVSVLLFAVVLAVVLIFARTTRLLWDPAESAGVWGLEKALGVECEIGKLSGDPLRAVDVERLVIGRDANSPAGALISVEQVKVRHRLLALLRAAPAAATVDSVEVKGLKVYAHRSTKGDWNLKELVPERKEREKKPGHFRGRIRVEGITVYFRDDSAAEERGRPFETKVRIKELVVDFAKRPRVSFQLTGKCPDGTLTSLSAKGSANVDEKALAATFALVGVDLPTWCALAPLPEGVDLTKGVVGVSGTIDLSQTEATRDLDFDTEVTLADFAVSAPALRRPVSGGRLKLACAGKVKTTGLGDNEPAAGAAKDSAGKTAKGKASNTLQLTSKGPQTTVTGKATLEGRIDHLGDLAIDAAFDTDEGFVSGTAKLGPVACRHWLDSLGANSVRLTNGTAAVVTDFDFRFPVGRAPTLNLGGNLQLAGGRLHPGGLRRPLTNLRSSLDYKLDLVFGKPTRVSGEAHARGGLTDFPNYEVRCDFDTGKSLIDANVRLTGANLLALPALLKDSSTFTPLSGRLGADMNVRVNLAAPIIEYDGRVTLTGFSGQIAKVKNPFGLLNLDLGVKGAAPLRGSAPISTHVVTLRPLPRVGNFDVQVDYRPADSGVYVDVNVDEVDVPFWSAMVLQEEGIRVHEGRATSRFTLDTKPSLAYRVEGDFRGLDVAVPQIERHVTQLAGRYEVAPDHVKLSGVSGALENTFFVVSEGDITNFSDVHLDLKVRGERLNIQELMRLAPNQDDLPKVAPAGDAEGEFTVVGKLASLDVSGEAKLPALSVEYGDFGVFDTKPMAVTVSVTGANAELPELDITAPTMQVDLDGLNRELLGPEGEHFAFPELAAVALQVTGTTKEPVIDVTAEVPAIRIGPNELTQIAARVHRAGTTTELHDVVAYLDQGRATVEGALRKEEETQRIELRGTATELDLRLAEPWLVNRGLDVAGLATGPFTVTRVGKTTDVTGKLALSRLRLTQRRKPPEAGPPREYAAASAGAEFGLRLLAGEEASTTTGDIETDLVALAVLLPGKQPDRKQVLRAEGVRAKLRLTPDALESARIEVSGYGGRVVLTDFRYGLDDGRLSARTEATGVRLAALSELTGRKDLGGVAAFRGNLLVTKDGPSLTGRAEVESLRVAESPECEVGAELELNWPELRVQPATVEALGCTVEGRGGFTMPVDENAPGTLDLRVTGGGAIREIAEAYVPESIPLSGNLSIEATVGGTFDRPTVRAQARLSGGEVKGVALSKLEARVVRTNETTRLETLEVEIGRAHFAARGNLTADRQLALTFAADPVPLATVLKFAGLTGPCRGALRLTEGSVTGPLDNPLVKASLSSADLGLNGHGLGALSAEVALRDQRLHLTPLTWKLNGGSLSIDGKLPVLGPEPGEPLEDVHLLDCTAEWKNLTFAELRDLGHEVSALMAHNERPATALDDTLFYFRRLKNMPEATLDGKALFRGTQRKPQIPEARFALTEGRVGPSPLPEVVFEGSYVDRVVDCRSLTAELDDMQLQAKGKIALDGEVGLDVEVVNFPLALVNPWVRGAPETSGLGDLTVLVRGPFEKPVVEGSIEIVEPAFRDAVVDRVSLDHFTLKDGAFVIEPGDLRLLKGDHILSAGCTLPVSYEGDPIPSDKPFEASARLVQGDLRLLRDLFPGAPRMLGELEAELAAKGTLDSPLFEGRVKVDDTNIELPGMDSNVHALTGEIRLEGGRRVVFDNFSAMLSPAPVDTTLLPQFRREMLTLTGDISLTDEGLRHPLENLFDLLVELKSLELQLADTTPLTGVESKISLKTRETDGREVLTVENLTAWGNGKSGPLEAHGTVVLPASAPKSVEVLNDSDIDLVATAQGLTLTRRPYGTLTFDLNNMKFADDPLREGKPVLRGDVIVHDTKLSPPKTKSTGAEPKPLPAFPHMDLFVMLAEDVQITHPALQASLGGGVTISGTPAEILVTGTLTSDKGMVRFPRAKAQLKRADVDINVQTDKLTKQLVSRIWVSAVAEAEVENYLIEIYMRGPLLLQETGESDMELRMSSTPQLAQEQIYALLIGSSPGGAGMGFQQIKEKFQDQVVKMFASQASGILTRKLREALGLDRLDLVWSDEGFSEIALGQRFGKLTLGVRKMLGRSAFDTAYQAEYQVSRQLSVDYEQDEFGTSKARLKFRFTFDTS